MRAQPKKTDSCGIKITAWERFRARNCRGRALFCKVWPGLTADRNLDISISEWPCQILRPTVKGSDTHCGIVPDVDVLVGKGDTIVYGNQMEDKMEFVLFLIGLTLQKKRRVPKHGRKLGK